MIKQALVNSSINDEIYTPDYAIYPILKYLNKSWIYWECTDYGDSNITKVLKDNGFKVISTNKEDFDFLVDNATFEFDCIITNPPYSLKDEFLKRAYIYNKPFMFLLPITALEGIKRNELYKKYGLELIIYDKRINFLNNKKSCWFNTSWFTWKVCLKELNFEHID